MYLFLDIKVWEGNWYYDIFLEKIEYNEEFGNFVVIESFDLESSFSLKKRRFRGVGV